MNLETANIILIFFLINYLFDNNKLRRESAAIERALRDRIAELQSRLTAALAQRRRVTDEPEAGYGEEPSAE